MQFSRQGSCNELGLIIATLALAVGVQWYGNHNVGAELFRLARDHFGEPESEPIAEAGQFFKFEEQDGFFKGLVVCAKASRYIEGIELIPAETTERLLRFAKFQLLRGFGKSSGNQERTPTALADGGTDRLE
jgi:hypothetical protein